MGFPVVGDPQLHARFTGMFYPGDRTEDQLEKDIAESYNFKTYINGKEFKRELVKAEPGRIIDNCNYYFTLNVEFKAGETLEIKNEYRQKNPEWDDSSGNYQKVYNYILETGRFCKGNPGLCTEIIDEGKPELVFSGIDGLDYDYVIDAYPAPFSIKEEGDYFIFEWLFRDFEPDFNISVAEFGLLPDFYSMEDYYLNRDPKVRNSRFAEIKYLYMARIMFKIPQIDSIYPERKEPFYSSWKYKNLQEYIGFLKDSLKALYGFEFSGRQISDYFKNFAWYIPGSENSEPLDIYNESMYLLENYESLFFPELININASSTLTEPFDKNAYHPVKVLDNDPKTMWIENGKGPGTDESISISLDREITADRIAFQPGCFWDKYWQQNYRIEELEIKTNSYSRIITFEDLMTDQSAYFPGKLTFNEIRFIIKKVYPTEKWEDTAISGIKFYFRNEEIPINLTEFEEGFEKKTE